MSHLKVRPGVIVTGAGSGIGRATSLALAREGFDLALAARTRDLLARTAKEVEAACPDSPGTHVIPTDVSDPIAIAALVAGARDRFHRLAALVNVAGHASLAPIDEITPDAWRRTVDTNLTSVVMTTAAVWPLFRNQGGGIVVNVSSMASLDPFPHFSMYAAAKAGVNMFTRAAAQEGDPLGIHVFCIAPGAVETPMLRSLFDTDLIPSDQVLPPEQIAEAIVARVRDPGGFENGETVSMPSP